MQEEIWKNTEYDGYIVSNKGRVKSKNKIKSQINNGNGYLFVILYKNNRGYHQYVHRLVAKAFLPNPNEWKEVNHKNGIRNDNRVENLEWCTRKYNRYHATIVLKTNKRKKRILCVETGDVFESTLKLEKITGLCSAAVRRVLCGQAKTSAGYHWQYTYRPTTNINNKKYRKNKRRSRNESVRIYN